MASAFTCFSYEFLYIFLMGRLGAISVHRAKFQHPLSMQAVQAAAAIRFQVRTRQDTAVMFHFFANMTVIKTTDRPMTSRNRAVVFTLVSQLPTSCTRDFCSAIRNFVKLVIRKNSIGNLTNCERNAPRKSREERRLITRHQRHLTIALAELRAVSNG